MSKYNITKNQPQAKVWANINGYTTKAKNGMELLRISIRATDIETLVNKLLEQQNEQGWCELTLFENNEFKKEWQETFYSVGWEKV